jgi:hypothetical protein
VKHDKFKVLKELSKNMDISLKAKLQFAIVAVLAVGLLFACASPAIPPTPPDEPPGQSEITTTPSDNSSTSPAPGESLNLPDRVDVVYFHRTNQCHCMQVIEDNISQTVTSNFQKELDTGKLTFTSLAVDDRANGAMVAKYNTGLFGLFITIVKDKTENIVPVGEIWTMTGDEAKYKEYVKNIVAKSLKGEL